MDLDAKAKRQLIKLAPWHRKVRKLIEDKVSDVRVHLVEAVREAKRLDQSPGFITAQSRMDDIVSSLAGFGTGSLKGVIRDAREEFYRQAWNEWRGVIPSDWVITPNSEPTQTGVTRARGMIIHGFDLTQEISGPVVRAKLSCRGLAAVTGRRDAVQSTGRNILDTWERQTVDSIWNRSRLALSDSQIAADVLAGRNLIRPEFLDESPITVG